MLASQVFPDKFQAKRCMYIARINHMYTYTCTTVSFAMHRGRYMQDFAHSLAHSFLYSSIHLCTHCFIYPLTCSCICLFSSIFLSFIVSII